MGFIRFISFHSSICSLICYGVFWVFWYSGNLVNCSRAVHCLVFYRHVLADTVLQQFFLSASTTAVKLRVEVFPITIFLSADFRLVMCLWNFLELNPALSSFRSALFSYRHLHPSVLRNESSVLLCSAKFCFAARGFFHLSKFCTDPFQEGTHVTQMALFCYLNKLSENLQHCSSSLTYFSLLPRVLLMDRRLSQMVFAAFV